MHASSYVFLLWSRREGDVFLGGDGLGAFGGLASLACANAQLSFSVTAAFLYVEWQNPYDSRVD